MADPDVRWDFRQRVPCVACGAGTYRHVLSFDQEFPLHGVCDFRAAGIAPGASKVTAPAVLPATPEPQAIDVASLARELAERVSQA